MVKPGLGDVLGRRQLALLIALVGFSGCSLKRGVQPVKPEVVAAPAPMPAVPELVPAPEPDVAPEPVEPPPAPVEPRDPRFTDASVHGSAQRPQLHRLRSGPAITWTDRRDGRRSTWLQRLGADLRPIGEPIPLTPKHLPVARAVALTDGAGRIALLMQVLVPPQRVNMVMVVSTAGQVVMEPVQLEGAGEVGRFGGALSHDGEAFQALWRSSTGRRDTINWARFSDRVIEAPVVVAREREGILDGGFLPFGAISLAADTGGAWIGFSRQARHDERGPSALRHHLLRIDAQGRRVAIAPVPSPSPMTQGGDLRFARSDKALMAFWTRTDLSIPRPIEELVGMRLGIGDATVGPARTLRSCPKGCHEMAPVGGAMIGVSAGELWAAPWSERSLGAPRRIASVAMTPGLVRPSALPIGEGIAITWIDESAVGGRLRTEVWLDWLSPPDPSDEHPPAG